ncbi:MAG: alpha/beta fold hydrolase, partial [Actinomycetota bacterium]
MTRRQNLNNATGSESAVSGGLNERRATVAGISMRWFESSGNGTPVVLLHGIPTSPLLWRQVVQQLEGCRVFAWEMVGYGGSWSVEDDKDISVRAQASYLQTWLDDQRLDDVILVGHDLGGGVAQIAAVQARQRVAGIVLANSISYDSWPLPSVKAMRAMGSLVGKLPRSMFRRLLGGFLKSGHEDAAIASESIDTHWRYYDRKDGAATFVRQIRSLDAADTLSIAPKLPELHIPGRVVWGADDKFQKLRYGERLARDLGLELDVIAGGKH